MEIFKYFGVGCAFIFSWLCVYVYFKIVKVDKRLKNFLDQFPGPKTVPIFGNALLVLSTDEFIERLKELYDRFGNTFRFWMANQPILIVGDPSDIEKILSSSHNVNKSKQYKFGESWIGTGLLTSPRDKWRIRRKLLIPAFHFKMLKDFLDVFNEKTSILTDILATKYADKNGEVNLPSLITPLTLDIICETAMGTQIDAQIRDSEYVRSIQKLKELILERVLKPWLHPQLIWKYSRQGRLEKKCLDVIHTFTEKIINERKNTRKAMESRKSQFETTPNLEDGGFQKNEENRKVFLDILLDASEISRHALTDLDIRDEVATFMFGGQDTSATTLGWVLFIMGTYPKVQERAQMELDEIFGEDKTRAVSMADTSGMNYLECCIKETLRLFPTVYTFVRMIDQDVNLANGTVIPAGVNCCISTYLLHRDPDLFPDPEKFDPDRFLPENCRNRHPCSFIPFSTGPRNCIGQKYALVEIKVVLAQLLRTFRFEALDNQKDLKIVPDLVYTPKGGLRFRVFKRSPDTLKLDLPKRFTHL